MPTLRRLAVATTFATFLLISVGATVRATGSGLGCPDWPQCYGRWLPPLTAAELPPSADPASFNAAKTWTEYVNRLIGVVIGFLVLGTTIAAWRAGRERRGLAWCATGALALVVFQAWLGGQVVKKELDPRLVTVHLLLALVLVGLLIRVAVASLDGHRWRLASDPGPPRARARAWIHMALAVAVLQVGVGALVRGSIDVEAKADAALPRGELLGRVGFVDPLHRDLALLVLVFVGLVTRAVWPLRRSLPPVVSHLVVAAGACVGLQILAGLWLAYGGLPPVAQVAHLSIGSWLVGALIGLALLVKRDPLG